MDDAEDDLPEKWDRSHFLSIALHQQTDPFLFRLWGTRKSSRFPGRFGPILPNKYSCLSGFLPAGLGRNPLRPAWPPVKSIHSTLEIPPQQILRANMLMPRSPSPYPTEDLNAPDSRTVVLSSAKEWALACVNSPPATKTRDHET